MVTLIPSQDLSCEHIQVPQLSPSPLHSHEPISQQRHGQGVCGIDFVPRVQLRFPYFRVRVSAVWKISVSVYTVHDTENLPFSADTPRIHRVGFPKVAAWQYADAHAAIRGSSTWQCADAPRISKSADERARLRIYVARSSCAYVGANVQVDVSKVSGRSTPLMKEVCCECM